ncbi:S8 family serine peptidase, partial [bacterium]|nr:S8 family serine peptidase [bacterium]
MLFDHSDGGWNLKRMLKILTIVMLAAVAHAQSPEVVPGQALVRFAEKTTLEQARGQFDPALFTVDDVLVKKLDIYLVKFDAKLGVDHALDLLRGYPQLKWAQADHILKQRAIPNDPSFSSQWDFQQVSDADIDAPEAWDITTGGTDAGGNDIVVAVVDGGALLTHTDLVPNLWQNTLEVNGTAGVDDDGNGYVDDQNGWDGYANDGSIPTNDHGTHVSGTIGARGNNGSMVTGINWNVKVMEVAASSSSTSVIQRGYGYVLDQKTLWLTSGG